MLLYEKLSYLFKIKIFTYQIQHKNLNKKTLDLIYNEDALITLAFTNWKYVPADRKPIEDQLKRWDFDEDQISILARILFPLIFIDKKEFKTEDEFLESIHPDLTKQDYKQIIYSIERIIYYINYIE